MSSSRPVPAGRSKKSGLAYQSLSQGVAASPDRARAAFCGFCPSALPRGPKAVTPATASFRGGGAGGPVIVAVLTGAVLAEAGLGGRVAAGAGGGGGPGGGGGG